MNPDQVSAIIGTLAVFAFIVIAYALLGKPERIDKLSTDEIALLRQAYAQRWVYPAGARPETIASLFRRGLIRPEGQEITLTESGKALFTGAGK